ncbi:ankyrin repeat domain-containing protein [Neoehrlichia mikurensis]|uniref:ankyrin repeat domain-containing protein n=1 Tax=Neoehrlichia mikurensis TaxID=89586 RepID=UPI001FE7DA28|nr:ankyrin repeat domain-containing protein [Neoehrlichia mikurensis]
MIDIKDDNIKGHDVEDDNIKGHDIKDDNIKGHDVEDDNIKGHDVEDDNIKGHDVEDDNIKGHDVEDDLNDYELFDNNHQKLYDNDGKLIDDEKNTKAKKHTKNKKTKNNSKDVDDKELEKKKNIIGHEDADIKEKESNNDIFQGEQGKQVQLSSSAKSASEWKNLNSGQSLLDQWLFYRNPIEFIEVRNYDEENSHLPKVTSLNDYYEQMFYCVRDNDVSGLRAVIYKLENLGINVTTVLEDLRTQEEGDNLLLYAIREGSIDAVRFLLSIGSKPDINNDHSETPLGIAVKNKRADIVNAIVEMQ